MQRKLYQIAIAKLTHSSASCGLKDDEGDPEDVLQIGRMCGRGPGGRDTTDDDDPETSRVDVQPLGQRCIF